MRPVAAPETQPPRAELKAAVELYLALHRAPELSGAEHSTAALLTDRLTALGLTVHPGLAGTPSFLAELRNGPGPTVLLRTELDALPVTEATGLPYASAVPGVMHACGHDLHAAAATGAAARLAATRADWQGRLLLLGQSAEETLTGARALADDGLYERFGRPDAVLAQHAAPLPAGTLAHATGGPLMAGSRTLEAVLHGRGGHAATPHLAADPLLMAASAVVRLHTLTACETAPAEGAVLTVGTLHAGTRANVIPDRATLSLGLRAFTEAALDRLQEAVRRVLAAESEAAAAPGPPELTVTARSPVLTPDPDLTASLRAVHAEHLGAGRVLAAVPSPATEDLTHLTRLADGTRIPLAYWMLGTTPAATWRAATAEGRPVPANHASDFAPDLRQALPAGITALTAAARHLFADGPHAVGAFPPSPEAAP
ncbi:MULTISPECIES: amidohydrolase [Streptomyces]|uniref:amidohydrolase n=1 Tax=Streptomyces TaxID=1883 RepID=UPI000F552CC2|nr:amidohydrolase [Streptomyces sp. ADI98-12]